MGTEVRIENTYAEAFRSIYAEVLITAKNKFWLDEYKYYIAWKV